jgi:hypothetical protein
MRALFEIGLCFLNNQRYWEAIPYFETYLCYDPQQIPAYSNLCYALTRLGRHREALEAIDRGLAIDPRNPAARLSKGYLLRSMGCFESAIDIFRQLDEEQLAEPEAKLSLAETLATMLQLTEATGLLEQLLKQYPRMNEARYALGKLHLLVGRFQQGFAECESRLDVAGHCFAPLSTPRWTGQQGQRLLVRCEQGLGDTIQFMRYWPLLPANCTIEVQPTLSELFSHLPLPMVEADATNIPPHDRQVYLMSLPHLFNTDLSTIPPPLAINRVRPRPHPNRIGFVWRGSPSHTKDVERSIQVELLQPLFSIPAIEAVCLQKDVSEEEAAFLDAHGVQRPRLSCWGDTVRELELCERVICVDTCIAHLAASMGLPTWILLSFSPDWRWMLDRSDSPWYPSAKLFRQTKMLQWKEPIEAIRREIIDRRCSI